MAALRAHKSSQGSAPAGFGALPQELQIRCVEFLALGDAASLAKQLSKGTRTAARRALTRARTQPDPTPARQGKKGSQISAYDRASELPPMSAKCRGFVVQNSSNHKVPLLCF